MTADQDVLVRLARIEEKLDHAIKDHGDDLQDHETRIRRLERVVWVAAGIGLTSGGAAGAAVTKLLGGA